GDSSPSKLAEPHGDRHSGDGLDQAVVIPDVGPLAFRVGSPRPVLAQVEYSPLAYAAGTLLDPAGWEARTPKVSGFDDVVVDRDDPRDRVHALTPTPDVSVSRPERSSVPDVIPVGSPPTMRLRPLTRTSMSPTPSERRRTPPPGRSWTRRGAVAPTVSGSSRTRSAALPGSIRPRPRSPRRRAGTSVNSCTAR